MPLHNVVSRSLCRIPVNEGIIKQDKDCLRGTARNTQKKQLLNVTYNVRELAKVAADRLTLLIVLKRAEHRKVGRSSRIDAGAVGERCEVRSFRCDADGIHGGNSNKIYSL